LLGSKNGCPFNFRLIPLSAKTFLNIDRSAVAARFVCPGEYESIRRAPVFI